MDVVKNNQTVDISFSSNPRMSLSDNTAMFLFPENSESFNLPTLTNYNGWYIDIKEITRKPWVTTDYLPEGAIKTFNFLNTINLKGKVILAINQRGELINYGAIGHKYYDDLIRLTPKIKEDVLEIQNSIDFQSGVRNAFPAPPTYHRLLKEKMS